MNQENWKEEMEEMEKGKTEEGSASASASSESGAKRPKIFGVLEDKTPEIMHCRNCNSLLENGVCPTCGFKAYVPMDPEQQKKIRLISGAVCVVVFIILLLITQAK